MSKKSVSLDLVNMVLRRQGEGTNLNTRTVEQILQEIQQEASADVDEDKQHPVKKQWVVVVYDPEGELAGKEFTGSVIQIPDDESVYTAVERLHRAGYEFNTTKKGRRMPVKTVGEVCEFVPARIAKEQKVWIRTKEPVFLLPTDGLLPKDCPAVQSRRVSQTPLFTGEPEAPGFEKRLDAAMCSLEDTWKRTGNEAAKAALAFLNLWKTDRAAAERFCLSPNAAACIKAAVQFSGAMQGEEKRLAQTLG